MTQGLVTNSFSTLMNTEDGNILIVGGLKKQGGNGSRKTRLTRHQIIKFNVTYVWKRGQRLMKSGPIGMKHIPVRQTFPRETEGKYSVMVSASVQYAE